MIDLRLGDCLEVLKTIETGSVDAVVTDPPAGIAFMGKAWDSFGGHCNKNAEQDRIANNQGPGAGLSNQPFGYSGSALPRKGEREAFISFLSDRLAECLRVAKPGSHLLCWALPRTSHWTGAAIEDAGWIIEDRIAHHFGSGFPKHKSKLKPATEDWWLATKPGGKKWLGVDACRIEAAGNDVNARDSKGSCGGYEVGMTGKPRGAWDGKTGRWPANLVLSHSENCVRRGTKRVRGTNPIGPNPGRLGYRGGGSPAPHDYADSDGLETIADYECVEGCPIRLMGEQTADQRAGRGDSAGVEVNKFHGWQHTCKDECRKPVGYGNGPPTAARFFPNFEADPFLYQAKASRRDRNEGCEGMEAKAQYRYADGEGFAGRTQDDDGRWINTDHTSRKPSPNHHPTVKSTPLMRWLCRLACPPGGMILDPFMGSGSTGKAATLEGFSFVGIERDESYFAIAQRRIRAAQAEPALF